MPGCLRTGMSGVAWLESTEGKETDDFVVVFVSFLLLKECFYRDRDVVCFLYKTTYGS